MSKTTADFNRLHAAASDAGDVMQWNADISFTAAAPAEDGKPAPLPRFAISAYNGGMMQVAWGLPVVVELSGLKANAKSIPILLNHDPEKIVGHTSDVTVTEGGVSLVGVISGTGSAAGEVVANSKNGFPWQASIGAAATRREIVEAGKSVTVNGKTFTGPLIVVRAAILKETSFVPIGADPTTTASIAATNQKGNTMQFEEWLKAKGFDPSTITDTAKTFLKAQYDAEIAAADNKKEETLPDAPSKTGTGTAPAPGVSEEVKTLRASYAAESKRVAAIHATAAKFVKTVPADKHSEITAKAIEEDWTNDKLELHFVRAERPASHPTPTGGSGGDKQDATVIEASLSLTAGLPEKTVAAGIPSDQRERVMNQALTAGMRGYSLHNLMDATLHASGTHFGGSRKSNDFIRAVLAADSQIRASGFSSLSLSGILSNVANKGLIASYSAVEVTWPKFCAVRSHGNFKVHTRYRLDSKGAFKKVGPDGELKHVGLSEASYTNQLNTYGAIIVLTRQMMIDDDLGAFMEIPTHLGRMSALRLEEAVFVLLLSNPSNFFGSGNANYISGGSSALGITSLSAVEKAFSDQVDSNNKPILVSPKVLLVGTPNKVTAENLFAEKLLIASGLAATNAKTVEPARNPHATKYPPVVSPYLNNTAIKDQDGAAITGQSDTQFYMFADPADRAALAVAFLNGQPTPTIESAQTDFNTLGMQWRGYHDFGVGLEDPKAAVKSAGQ